jgi:hypothetical protein
LVLDCLGLDLFGTSITTLVGEQQIGSIKKSIGSRTVDDFSDVGVFLVSRRGQTGQWYFQRIWGGTCGEPRLGILSEHLHLAQLSCYPKIHTSRGMARQSRKTVDGIYWLFTYRAPGRSTLKNTEVKIKSHSPSSIPSLFFIRYLLLQYMLQNAFRRGLHRIKQMQPVRSELGLYWRRMGEGDDTS